ncbi:unnamed protein product [Lathyrus oleraceus]
MGDCGVSGPRMGMLHAENYNAGLKNAENYNAGLKNECCRMFGCRNREKNSKLKKMMKPRLREIEDGRVKILAESSFTNGVWRMPGIEDWNSVMKRDCGADCRIKKSSGCRVVD